MHLYIQKKKNRDENLKVKTTGSQSILFVVWQKHLETLWRQVGCSWTLNPHLPWLKKWFSLLSHFRVITMVIIRTHKQITSKVTNRVPGCPKAHVEAVVPSVLTWYKGHACLCATDCSAWWRHQAAEAKAFCSLEGHFCTRNRNVTFLKFHPPTKKTHGH